MKINKVVIPVAGWGTRSLPASKNIPKEMLPVFNKPVIQYVVEEALRLVNTLANQIADEVKRALA